MTYEYYKINFDDIKGYEKGVLFRSNNQENFEQKILSSFLENKKPSYYGIKEDNKKITFCDHIVPHWVYFNEYGPKMVENKFDNIRSLLYQLKNEEISPWEYEKEKKRIVNNTESPFTQYPIILKINAENYKDKLYVTNGGEGLIIRDDISLDDIDVLYSSNIDKSKNYKNKIIKKKIKYMIESFEKDFKNLLELADIKKEENTLIYKYNKNKLFLRGILEIILQKEIDENKLKRGVDILKEKLNY